MRKNKVAMFIYETHFNHIVDHVYRFMTYTDMWKQYSDHVVEGSGLLLCNFQRYYPHYFSLTHVFFWNTLYNDLVIGIFIVMGNQGEGVSIVMGNHSEKIPVTVKNFEKFSVSHPFFKWPNFKRFSVSSLF